MKAPGLNYNKVSVFKLSLFLIKGGFLGLLVLAGCGGNSTRNQANGTNEKNSGKASGQENAIFKKLSPDINVDSIYEYSQNQVNFGPRIPGTSAHENCAKYLLGKLKSFGLISYFHEGLVKVYTGKTFPLKNIIGSFNPEQKERILLTAHWDTRPFSDQEPNLKDQNKEFDGANDGASGVGILLELARQLSIHKPSIGVDFIFWDIEDYGMKNDGKGEKTWCLGSRYWVSHPPVKNYNPLYNINLDMAGGIGAIFNWEEYSYSNAAELVKSVWDIGNQLGYSTYFSYTKVGSIIDDHVVVNEGTNIPAIDIVDFNDASGFYKYWHKQGDNMKNIDKGVMKAVGQTVLEKVYQEAKSK